MTDVDVTLPDRSRQRVCSPAAASRSRTRAATRPSASRTSARPWRTRTWTRCRSPRCNHWHCADDVLGLPGGQGRVRREALQPQHVRGPAVRRGGAEDTSCIVQHGTQSRVQQQLGQAPVAAIASGKYGKLLVSKGYASKPRWTHRLQGAETTRRPSSTSICGWARPRSSPTTRTSCTTTGTGSGTSATARSATRACTRWTSPAGRSPAARCPRAWSAWAAVGSTRRGPQASPTRAKRRTCRSR